MCHKGTMVQTLTTPHTWQHRQHPTPSQKRWRKKIIEIDNISPALESLDTSASAWLTKSSLFPCTYRLSRSLSISASFSSLSLWTTFKEKKVAHKNANELFVLDNLQNRLKYDLDTISNSFRKQQSSWHWEISKCSLTNIVN